MGVIAGETAGTAGALATAVGGVAGLVRVQEQSETVMVVGCSTVNVWPPTVVVPASG